tara:strand:- start:337 stop:525 length:189 start_codon:yes stop_codon:yes gene_type:complete
VTGLVDTFVRPEVSSNLTVITKNQVMIEKLDKLAQEIFGEFGFDTCTLEQQLIIIKLNTNDR